VRLKVIEVSFKTSQEISRMVHINVQNPNPNTGDMLIEEPKKEKLTADQIMEVLCTFNQEGLGPLKWWNPDK
jgi:hypothetical protein